MRNTDWEKMEDLHCKWLEENCACPSVRLCKCMDLGEWYKEEMEVIYEDNEREELA
jgi:endogenous inhibitor of DNA gyrase (YacG/DUF329 family)